MATKFGNFMIGCVVFLLLGFFGSIGMSVYVRGRAGSDAALKNTYQW